MAWTRRKLHPPKKKEAEPVFCSLDEPYKIPAMTLLKMLFSHEKTVGATPPKLLQEIVKRVDPSYSLVGLKTIKGEGAIIKALDRAKQEICLKVMRPSCNLKFVDELNKDDFDRDEWLRFTATVKRFNERFSAGVQIQIALKRKIKELRIGHFDVPEYRKMSDSPFLYLEQEWIEGVDLLEWLKEKNNLILNLEQFKYLLDCVQFCHFNGIIHRDIKTSNVMISGLSEKQSKLYLLDWTTGKYVGVDRGLTIASEGLGTYGYAPPEQLSEKKAKDADEQNDIYSLGMCLFEVWHMSLLPEIGQREWEDKDKAQAFLNRCKQALPDVLVPIFTKATNLKRADRYKTVEDFSSDIVKAIQKLATQPKINSYKIVDASKFTEDLIEPPTHDETLIDVLLDAKDLALCDTCQHKAQTCNKYNLCVQFVSALQELQGKNYI